MNVNIRLASLAFLLSGILGCSANGHFFPVQGPLAAQVPPPEFEAHFAAHLHAHTLTVTLLGDHGEQVAGTLEQAFPVLKKPNTAPPPMPMQWDAVYGQGSYVSSVLGQGQDARGTLTGSNGTTMNVEIYGNNPPGGPPRGVAQDNKGNLYKITF